RVAGHQPALGIARYANPALAAARPLEPVNRRQHLLHFIADDVAAHVKRLPINPFAMRLVRHADIRMARPSRAAVHQRRDHYAETTFRQPPRELLLRSDAGSHSAELLRRLIGIGKSYDMPMTSGHRFE